MNECSGAIVVYKSAYVHCKCRIQGAGVGGLRHNTVLLGWPNNWRLGTKSYKAFRGRCTTSVSIACTFTLGFYCKI